MKRGQRFTDSERISLLQKWDEKKSQGRTRKELALEFGVSAFSIDCWRKKYGENPVAPAREIVAKSNGHDAELKQLRIENSRLKIIVADRMLDIQALLEFQGKS